MHNFNEKIRVDFEFEGNPDAVNRAGFESAEQFKQIAHDMVHKGYYVGAIKANYNIGTSEQFTNAFRAGPGQRYLITLLDQPGVVAHPHFWEREAGRKIALVRPDLKAVKAEVEVIEVPDPQPEVDQIAAQAGALLAEEVKVEPNNEDSWFLRMSAQLDQLEAGIKLMRDNIQKLDAESKPQKRGWGQSQR